MIPTHIILHHSLTKDSETVSWQAIRKYHVGELGWSDIGYHFGIELINERYEIICGRPMNAVGAHCYQEGMNRKSIGICMVGNFDEIEPNVKQMAALKNLLKALMEVAGIPKENIHMHREFAQYKSCPGTKFPFEALIASL